MFLWHHGFEIYVCYLTLTVFLLSSIEYSSHFMDEETEA